MKRTGIVLLVLCIAAQLNAAPLLERGGDVYSVDDEGQSRRVTFERKSIDAVLSSDGKAILYVRSVSSGEPDDGASELWLTDTESERSTLLLASRVDEVPEKNLEFLNSPVFTRDGSGAYFLSAAWATSNAVHRIDFQDKTTVFVTDGNEIVLVDKGRYAGHLIVLKHKYLPNGGAYEHYWLVSPEGKEVRKVGATKREVERFLKNQ